MPEANSSRQNEIIRPAQVSAAPVQTATTTNAIFGTISTGTWIWLGLLLLLALALFVIFLLPRTIDVASTNKPAVEPTTIAPPPQTSEALNPNSVQVVEPNPTPTTQNTAEQQQAKIQAEQLLSSIIELEARLEKHAVQKWAAEQYALAAEQGRVGDEHFRRGQFSSAIESFQLAIVQLRELQDRVQPTLKQALLHGKQALTQGDKATAIQQFTLAQSIEASNVQAINGLQRAQTIEQLFTLLQRGNSFESHSQLQPAKATYQEALELDPLSEEAKSALKRVNAKLVQQEFDQLIASGYRSLQNGQYADANAAFNAAKKITPASE